MKRRVLQSSRCIALPIALVTVLALLLAGCGWFSPAEVPPAPTSDTADTEATEPDGATEPTEAEASEEPTEATEPTELAIPTEPEAATPETAELPPGPGGNLLMPLSAQDPTTLDPALVSDTTSAFVARQLFSGLVRLDNNLEVQPDLAERWDVSDDGRTYTFYLRPDARFADGSPITAEDVRYSLERATDPALAPSLSAELYLTDIEGVDAKLAGEVAEISGLEVIDEQTIELTINEPKSYFLAKLTNSPAYVVDQETVERGGEEWTQQPNGSGPFAMERWDSNSVMVLRRNVNYYGDLARLDRVTLLMGASASNPMVLYEQGDIDVTNVPSFALARVQDESNPLSEELVSVPELSLSFVGMNVNEPPFDDPNVREAFSLMLDQARIAEVSLNDSVEPARGILPPGIPGYNEELLDSPAPTADLERARELLAESNYGGAENLPPIAAYGGGWTGTLAEIAREEFGIEMEVRAYENFGAFMAALDEENLPMFGYGWVADYPDPENFLRVLFHSESAENNMNYANPEVDALLEEAAVERDDQRRAELYQQAEQLILADVPAIPIIHGVNHMLVKPYVEGLVVTPMGILDLSTVELVRES